MSGTVVPAGTGRGTRARWRRRVLDRLFPDLADIRRHLAEIETNIQHLEHVEHFYVTSPRRGTPIGDGRGTGPGTRVPGPPGRQP
jgi:hypothetical protein